MSIAVTTEKRFEEDIESFFLAPAGGYTKGTDTYDAKLGLYVNTLIDFVQRTQPKEWARFENANQVDEASTENQKKTRFIECSECGTENDSDAKYCINCGAKITQERKCANCGQVLDESTKYCPECRRKVER